MSVSDESKVTPARRIQFAFTNEQEEFRAAIRRFLQEKSPPTEVRRLMETAEGYDPETWRQLSDQLALPGIHIPEPYGGAGFGMVELCIVTEEMGRALLCAPYFSTAVLATNAILNAGTEAQQSSLLPELASGTRLAALAVTEPNGQWDPQAIELVATPVVDGYLLEPALNQVVLEPRLHARASFSGGSTVPSLRRPSHLDIGTAFGRIGTASGRHSSPP